MIDRDQLTEALAAVELVMIQDGYGTDAAWQKVRNAVLGYLAFPSDAAVRAIAPYTPGDDPRQALIDRDQLTEALAYYDRAAAEIDNPDGSLVTVADAARLLLDFPTDEHVEAAALAFAGLDSWDEDLRERSHREQWRAQARAALEVVRQVMFGGSDD